ncbi:hypothetical protein BpHYR1_050480 [Brachionus plicatilis]|uniref:Uncharacterized protein n=1 Tax=Brachionus plicatilis TaxID=10195 RepID=A0A3M7QAT4_BRAPC|nr:hypothetical protein BpHYR1_050480 [Brachionus plicatilis]
MIENIFFIFLILPFFSTTGQFVQTTENYQSSRDLSPNLKLYWNHDDTEITFHKIRKKKNLFSSNKNFKCYGSNQSKISVCLKLKFFFSKNHWFNVFFEFNWSKEKISF